jgi:hypothetical protein
MNEEEIAELVSGLEGTVQDAVHFLDKMESDAKVRYCQWDGQDDDGRKHADNLGEVPFPWEGCSDDRVRLADSIIAEDVRMMKLAWARSRIKAVGIESSDVKRASKVTTLLKWLFKSRLNVRARREIELAANWRQTYGLAVMGVFWDQETRHEETTITMDEVMAMAQQAPELGEVIRTIQDPLLEGEAIMGVSQALQLDEKDSKKVVIGLREKGTATYSKPYLFRNEPKLEALKPYFDVFFPVSTLSIQDSSMVYRRVLLSEVQLRDKVLTEGWDEEFVERIIDKYKGFSSMGLVSEAFHGGPERTLSEKAWYYTEDEDVFEVFYAYTKETDDDTGAVKCYCTVMHGNIKDTIGKRTEMQYVHGEMPFVEMPRERPERCLVESRGIPEIVQTWQSAKKLCRDYRQDRASISILPPVKVPLSRATQQLTFGPAVQIPERRPGEISFMAPPPADQGVDMVETLIEKDVEETFRSPLYSQDLATSWLADLTAVAQQVLALCQQYMTPQELMRVVGGQEPPFEADKESIQGRYDLSMQFDARDLDHEFLEQKINLIAQMVTPLDSVGVLDRVGLIQRIMDAIDPNMAEELIKPVEEVTQKEAEEEKMEFAKMASGIESTLKPENSGQNVQLRLQVLQDIVQKNPSIQQKLQEDQTFGALVEQRMKHFQFLMQQRQNAQIGRVGVESVLGG